MNPYCSDEILERKVAGVKHIIDCKLRVEVAFDFHERNTSLFFSVDGFSFSVIVFSCLACAAQFTTIIT